MTKERRELVDWRTLEDLGHGWKSLLLGNGFSINIWKRFEYGSLFDISKRKDIGECLDEKSIALSTALMAKKHLNEMGYRVIMTRNRDIFIPLNQRAHLGKSSIVPHLE